jgi:hypothetical protein
MQTKGQYFPLVSFLLKDISHKLSTEKKINEIILPSQSCKPKTEYNIAAK